MGSSSLVMSWMMTTAALLAPVRSRKGVIKAGRDGSIASHDGGWEGVMSQHRPPLSRIATAPTSALIALQTRLRPRLR